MNQLLVCIVLTALFVNGLDIATQPGMLLYFIRRWLNKLFIRTVAVKGTAENPQAINYRQVVSKWYYPLLYCIKCMPSVYGTLICLLLLPFGAHLLYAIPVVVVCSVALASILHTQYL